MATYSYVLLRNDSVLKSLTQPYTGPHKIIKRTNKTFAIEVSNTEKPVSDDRLKLAKTA